MSTNPGDRILEVFAVAMMVVGGTLWLSQIVLLVRESWRHRREIKDQGRLE